MAFTTDIPEWCFAEANNSELRLPPTADELTNLYKRSPIAFPIIAPILIIHGEKDQRVPVTQAKEVYKVMKTSGVPVKMLIYPEDGHALASHKASIDIIINTLLWIEEHIKG